MVFTFSKVLMFTQCIQLHALSHSLPLESNASIPNYWQFRQSSSEGFVWATKVSNCKEERKKKQIWKNFNQQQCSLLSRNDIDRFNQPPFAGVPNLKIDTEYRMKVWNTFQTSLHMEQKTMDWIQFHNKCHTNLLFLEKYACESASHQRGIMCAFYAWLSKNLQQFLCMKMWTKLEPYPTKNVTDFQYESKRWFWTG